LSKYKVQILLADMMHKHNEFMAWKHYKFETVFNLFEEDETPNFTGISDLKDEGLDRSEFLKLIKRMAQL